MISFRSLRADEIECRVAQCTENGVSLLLYKDARCDMRILDEVVGAENWECSYERIGESLFCTVRILCTPEGCDAKTWVSKQDTGNPSNMEPTKGEASDAFKRACFKWGIGRELYTAPRIWVAADKCKIKQGRNNKLVCYDRFVVTKLECEDGVIKELRIVNASRGDICAFDMGGNPKKQEKPEDFALMAAKQRMWEAIKRWAALHERTPESVLEGVKKRPQWAEAADFFTAVAIEFEDDVKQQQELDGIADGGANANG